MVRAKVQVQSIQHFPHSRTVHFQAVAGPENDSYSRYTPYGKIELGITNPEAYQKFVVGGEYYVDFTPVDGVKAGAQ